MLRQPADPSGKDSKTRLTNRNIHKDLPNDSSCQRQQRGACSVIFSNVSASPMQHRHATLEHRHATLHNPEEMRKRSRQGKPYLAQVGFAGEVIDEGFGCQALVVGGVAGVHLDAGVHNGHPVLLAAVQLLHKGLHTNSPQLMRRQDVL